MRHTTSPRADFYSEKSSKQGGSSGTQALHSVLSWGVVPKLDYVVWA